MSGRCLNLILWLCHDSSMKLAFATLLVAADLVAAGSGLETIVKTDSGWVSGAGTTIRSYKGIPYAAPPAGDLRWKPPQPVKPRKGIRVAKEFLRYAAK